MHTPHGAILVASSQFSSLLDSAGESLFDPGHWRALGALSPTAAGRGSAWFVRSGAEEWVLRHYRRGGFVARFLTDTYVWGGEARVRAFAELRLIRELHDKGLPVPAPVAAAYRRRGGLYRCDLLTRRIRGGTPLSERLACAPLSMERWREIGAVIARFHATGVDHADLNAHNILLDEGHGVSLIDFDRGRLRPPGGWRHGNLARLHRSLQKIQRNLPPDRFDPACWRALLAGYGP